MDTKELPPGPWDDEPDLKQWQSETGLACVVRRVEGLGHLCGYVGVPEGHPLHGVSYGDSHVSLEPLLRQRFSAKVKLDEVGVVVMMASILGQSPSPSPEMAIAVHGGVTYSAPCDGRLCRISAGECICGRWVFGFDCAHSGDLVPGNDLHNTLMGGSYRTMDYAVEQTEKLAAQLAEVASGAN